MSAKLKQVATKQNKHISTTKQNIVKENQLFTVVVTSQVICWAKDEKEAKEIAERDTIISCYESEFEDHPKAALAGHFVVNCFDTKHLKQWMENKPLNYSGELSTKQLSELKNSNIILGDKKINIDDSLMEELIDSLSGIDEIHSYINEPNKSYNIQISINRK